MNIRSRVKNRSQKRVLHNGLQVLTSEIERLNEVVVERDTALQQWQREAELASQLAEVSSAPDPDLEQ